MEEICDIGPSLNLNQTEIDGIRFIEMGEQPATVISNLMADSLAGIVYSTDNERLAKSGVFATYCAHGLVPIVTQADSPLMDGLQVDHHFLFAGLKAAVLEDDRLQAIAQAAYQWYSDHNQANTVKCFASHLLAKT